MKCYPINSCKISAQRGFALVMTLVFMILVMTAAAGLYLSRQMWAFNSQKHLDAAVMDLMTTTDATRWNMQIRDQLQVEGTVDFRQQQTASQPASATSLGANLDPAIAGVGLFPPTAAYPFHDPDNAEVFTFPAIFPDTQYGLDTVPWGSKDVLYGTPGVIWRGGANFQREMDDTVDLVRAGRFAPATTQLRGLFSIDGALPTKIVMRSIPVSAFTYYVGRGVGAVPVIGPSDAETGLPFNESSQSYTYGDYTATAGCGRIYVDGTLGISPGVAATFSTGFPLVVTDGLQLGSVVNFNFPGTKGGNSTGPLTVDAAFVSQAQNTTRGQLVTNRESPTRLMVPGASRDADGRWAPGSVAALVNEIGASAPYRIDVNVDAISVGFWDKANEVYAPPTWVTGSWSIDVVNKIVFYVPNPAMDVSELPGILHVVISGTDAALYELRISMPRANLSAKSENEGVSIVSENPICIVGNFNSAGNVNAMVVSPEIRVLPYPSTFTEFVASGVFITEAADPTAPLRYYGVGTAPTYSLNGALVLWRTTSVSGGVSAGLSVTPEFRYLSGDWLPPGVPAVSDYRTLTEGFWLYKPFSVTPYDQQAVIPYSGDE